MSSNVYLIKSGLYCKIGKANDVGKRVRGLQMSSPRPIELLWSTEVDTEQAAFELEKELHEEYAHRRTHGEWFWYHPSIEWSVAHLGDVVTQLSWSDMADWIRAFVGTPAARKTHIDERLFFLDCEIDAPAWTDGKGAAYGYTREYGYQDNIVTGFYKLTPDGAAVLVGFDGKCRIFEPGRIGRVYELSLARFSRMYREARQALNHLMRARVVGTTTAGKVYDFVFAANPRRPEPDTFPDEDLYKRAYREWDDGTDVLDRLMAMGYITQLDDSGWSGMEAETPFFVWPVPAPALKMRSVALPSPARGKP